MSKPRKRKFVCSNETLVGDLCGKTFPSQNALDVHLASSIHSAVPTFTCQVPNCGKAFFNKTNLRRHKEAVHDIWERSKKTFACGECSLTFLRRYNRDRHMQRTHGAGPLAADRGGQTVDAPDGLLTALNDIQIDPSVQVELPKTRSADAVDPRMNTDPHRYVGDLDAPLPATRPLLLVPLPAASASHHSDLASMGPLDHDARDFSRGGSMASTRTAFDRADALRMPYPNGGLPSGPGGMQHAFAASVAAVASSSSSCSPSSCSSSQTPQSPALSPLPPRQLQQLQHQLQLESGGFGSLASRHQQQQPSWATSPPLPAGSPAGASGLRPLTALPAGAHARPVATPAPRSSLYSAVGDVLRTTFFGSTRAGPAPVPSAPVAPTAAFFHPMSVPVPKGMGAARGRVGEDAAWQSTANQEHQQQQQKQQQQQQPRPLSELAAAHALLALGNPRSPGLGASTGLPTDPGLLNRNPTCGLLGNPGFTLAPLSGSSSVTGGLGGMRRSGGLSDLSAF